MIRSGYLRITHDRLLFFQVWSNIGSLSIDIDREGAWRQDQAIAPALLFF